MKLIKVNSTNINQIGYDESVVLSFGRKPTSILRIVFTSGITYDFYNVENVVFKQFLQAKSVGSYFHKNIKNRYDYEKK